MSVSFTAMSPLLSDSSASVNIWATLRWRLPRWLSGKKKNLLAYAGGIGDAGSIPGSGRSRGGGNGNPLQHPCLENPMDRGAWRAVVHAVSLSRTRLRDWTTLRSRECYPGGCICSQFLDGEGRGELAKQASGELSSRTTWPSHSGRPLHPLLRTPFGGLAPHLITQDLQPEVPQPGPRRRRRGGANRRVRPLGDGDWWTHVPIRVLPWPTNILLFPFRVNNH